MTSQTSVAVCREKQRQAPSAETDLTLGDGADSDRMCSKRAERGATQNHDKVEVRQADVSRDEWRLRSQSDWVRAGGGDRVNHDHTGNAGRQGGAVTEQSTHSASRAEGEWRCSGFKMHEMQQGVRWGGEGRHVFLHLEKLAVGHVLTLTGKILVMNGQFLHDCWVWITKIF